MNELSQGVEYGAASPGNLDASGATFSDFYVSIGTLCFFLFLPFCLRLKP